MRYQDRLSEGQVNIIRMLFKLGYNILGVLSEGGFAGFFLENLKYRHTTRLRLLLFTFSRILIPFVIKRLKKIENRPYRRVIKVLKKLLEGVNVFFFFKFLVTGNHDVDLFHYLFGISYEPAVMGKRRFLDYQYLNRTIIWDYMSTLILLLFPVISKSRVISQIRNLLVSTSNSGSFLNKLKSNRIEFECGVCKTPKPVNVSSNKKLS